LHSFILSKNAASEELANCCSDGEKGDFCDKNGCF
jgi:hypothetical protein